MLDAVVPLEIRRRRWVIKNIVKRIAKVPEADRAEWLIVNQSEVNRSIEDLLELSLCVSSFVLTDSIPKLIFRGIYKPRYREQAIDQGVAIQELFEASDVLVLREAPKATSLLYMMAKTLPLCVCNMLHLRRGC